MAQCKKCGACCRFVKVPVKELRPDTVRWLNLHWGLSVKDGFLWIDAPCSHLTPDGLCGLSWDSKPGICKSFEPNGPDCLEARRRARR